MRQALPTLLAGRSCEAMSLYTVVVETFMTSATSLTRISSSTGPSSRHFSWPSRRLPQPCNMLDIFNIFHNFNKANTSYSRIVTRAKEIKSFSD